jgi:nucleoside 2-deoxyribosyltransferase
MKFYIATSLSRAKAHNVVRDVLMECGHEISYDWTLPENKRPISNESLREIALLEVEGVSDSDFVIVLLPGGNGTHLELGISIAKGKRIFLHAEDPHTFEPGPQTNAFYHHPDIIRLHCPLPEVGMLVNSLLMEPAAHCVG